MIDAGLFLLGLGGFFWGGLATPLSIRLARSYRILDLPDARKIHTGQMPRGAGLVLWTGYLLWALYAVAEAPSVRFTALGAEPVPEAGAPSPELGSGGPAAGAAPSDGLCVRRLDCGGHERL